MYFVIEPIDLVFILFQYLGIPLLQLHNLVLVVLLIFLHDLFNFAGILQLQFNLPVVNLELWPLIKLVLYKVELIFYVDADLTSLPFPDLQLRNILLEHFVITLEVSDGVKFLLLRFLKIVHVAFKLFQIGI